MKKQNIKRFTCLLFALLIFLSGCDAGQHDPTVENTQMPTESTTQLQPTTTDPTETVPQPTETLPTETEPAETMPDPTDPPETEPVETGDPEDQIGDLYTRGQLIALKNDTVAYGCGTSKNGKRAPYAVQEQKKYGDRGAVCIGEDEPVIYLTFDCGYEYNNNTATILDVLAEKNVKAVFFITGNYAKKNPELVRRMIDEGHAVGSHSTNHPDMTTLTIDEMASELTVIHDYVLQHYGYEMTLFRPPQGRFSLRSLAVAESFGYKTVLWSVAYVDYEVDNQPDPEDALKKMKKRAHNGAIYLMHAISDTNAAILGDLIDHLQSEGYSIDLLS